MSSDYKKQKSALPNQVERCALSCQLVVEEKVRTLPIVWFWTKIGCVQRAILKTFILRNRPKIL
jgi:hypothetical protein